MNVFEITEQQPEVGIWVLVWHQNTWLKGCRLHDGWRIIYADGQHDYETAIVTHWTYLPPKPGDESPSSDLQHISATAAKHFIDHLIHFGHIVWYGRRLEDIWKEYVAKNKLSPSSDPAEVLVKALEKIANRPEPPKGQREGDAWVSSIRDVARTALDQHEQLKKL